MRAAKALCAHAHAREPVRKLTLSLDPKRSRPQISAKRIRLLALTWGRPSTKTSASSWDPTPCRSMEVTQRRALADKQSRERCAHGAVAGGPRERARSDRDSRITRAGHSRVQEKRSLRLPTDRSGRWIADAIPASLQTQQKRGRWPRRLVLPNIDGKLHLKELVEQVDALTRDVVLWSGCSASTKRCHRCGNPQLHGWRAAKGAGHQKACAEHERRQRKAAPCCRRAVSKARRKSTPSSGSSRGGSPKPIEPDAKGLSPVEVPIAGRLASRLPGDRRRSGGMVIPGGRLPRTSITKSMRMAYGQSFLRPVAAT